MKKFKLGLTLLAIFAMTSIANAGGVGYIDYARVIDNYDYAKQVTKEVDAKGLELQQYMVDKEKQYKNLDTPVKKKNFEETVNSIHETITSSIDYHRIADVEVGSFLSSGVDSSYVVSYAKPDKTYTVGFNYDNFDETVYAKDLSKILEIKNTSIIISDEEFFT